MKWNPIDESRINWLYSGTAYDDRERVCVGHLRGDFGRSGNEFWSAWFDHLKPLRTRALVSEINKVVNELRKPGGLLKDLVSMRKSCRAGTPCGEDYGFESETAANRYCLRCIPRRGEYNFYLYVYAKA